MLTDEERSVHTVMVYLNAHTDYTGGNTVFYSASTASGGSEALTQTSAVSGRLGSGLVFRHETWHEVRPPKSVVCLSVCMHMSGLLRSRTRVRR